MMDISEKPLPKSTTLKVAEALDSHAPPRPRRAPGPGGPFSALRMVHNPLPLISADWKRYGDVVRYRLATMPGFVVVHPEGIKHVLQENHRNYVKSPDYRILARLLGDGLLTSEGELWTRQHRLIAPVVHHERITEFGATMVDSTLRMLDRWNPIASERRSFDVCNEMMKLTLEIIARVLPKVEIAGELTRQIGNAVTLVNERFGEFDLGTLLPFLPTPANLRSRRAGLTLHRIIASVIAERRLDGRDRGDLLSLLLAARDPDTGVAMNDKELRDELLTMILAGHETIANALSWTWYMLSQNPEPEQKLHRELIDVLGGRAPTIADLPNLPYTAIVINESMRLYPPVWAVGRSPIADDQILGFAIPKGASVMLCPWLTHRHPDFWEEPERFDPERFSPEQSAIRPRHAYFPFGGGPRQCIGNVLALTEATLILASVAQKYRLRMVPGHRVDPQPLVTLRPRYGLKMTLEATKVRAG
ncbi:MAG: cytochrome P450 [Candidatus Binataceae bacterium]